MNVKEIKDIAGRFDISDTEADRIADAVESEAEFIAVWENHNWWTDEITTNHRGATAFTTQEKDRWHLIERWLTARQTTCRVFLKNWRKRD